MIKKTKKSGKETDNGGKKKNLCHGSVGKKKWQQFSQCVQKVEKNIGAA